MEQPSQRLLIATTLHRKQVLLISENGSEISKFVSFGANVTIIISKPPSEKQFELIRNNNYIYHVREFKVSDVNKMDMVFCYSNDPVIARLVYDVSQMKTLVTCPNFPIYSNFHLIPQKNLGELTIGASTNGETPLVVTRIVEDLIRAIPTSSTATIANIQKLKKHVRYTETSVFTNSERMQNLDKVINNMSMDKLSLITPNVIDRLLDSMEGIDGEYRKINAIHRFIVDDNDEPVSPTDSQASSTNTLVESVKYAASDPLASIKALIYNRANVMEKANHVYNETKHLLQDQINSYTENAHNVYNETKHSVQDQINSYTENAHNVYNETKHSVQDQINSYTAYPSSIINESQNKLYQTYDKCVDVKQKVNSKITSIVKDRFYEPIAAKSFYIHEIFHSSVGKIKSNPLVTKSFTTVQNILVNKVYQPASKSPVVNKSFRTTLEKIKSWSLFAKPYYKVERMMFGMVAGLVPYPKA